MARFIQTERISGATGERYRFPAMADEVLARLGVKRLPDAGMPERLIDGVRVYVTPKPEATFYNGRRVRMVALRVMAICECGKHVAVGRLRQHKCKVEGGVL